METQELVVNTEQQEAIDEANHLDELKEVLEQKIRTGNRFSNHDKIVDFVRKLQKSGIDTEELKNFKVYHLLIGSNGGNPTELDLPNQRIEKFIRAGFIEKH